MRRVLGLLVVVALGAAMLVPAMSTGRATAEENGETAHLPPLEPWQIPRDIVRAINSSSRPLDDKLLDAGRKPAQMLAFFGVRSGLKAADLFAGGGYTTELLALVVGRRGRVYSQNPPFPPEFKQLEMTWKARLKGPALRNVVPVIRPFDSDDLLPVRPESLDLVVMNMNYHDLVWMNVDRTKMNASIFEALKPGGVYGIVDHSAQPRSGIRDVKTLHRIDEEIVVDEITEAGFKLAATSSALRNIADDRTWLVFEHRGYTDRFTLKFVKP